MSTSWGDLKVLVTGARGFLGSHVAERLVQLGARTYGVARELPASDAGIRWFRGELTDPDTVHELVKQASPDVVFHLAGQTAASADRELVLSSLRNNLLTSVILMTELAAVGCRRIVVTGSLEEPIPGETGVEQSPYALSKWATAVYARMFHALYQLPVVIVRPYMTYGPRQRPTKFIPSVTLSLLRGDAPTVSQPDREVDWIYIDDVVDGILAAARGDGLEGLTLDLGTGVLVSVREIAMHLQRILGVATTLRIANVGRSVAVDGRRADTDQTRKLLGWSPKISLQKGLEQTVAWYRAQLLHGTG